MLSLLILRRSQEAARRRVHRVIAVVISDAVWQQSGHQQNQKAIGCVSTIHKDCSCSARGCIRRAKFCGPRHCKAVRSFACCRSKGAAAGKPPCHERKATQPLPTQRSRAAYGHGRAHHTTTTATGVFLFLASRWHEPGECDRCHSLHGSRRVGDALGGKAGPLASRPQCEQQPRRGSAASRSA